MSTINALPHVPRQVQDREMFRWFDLMRTWLGRVITLSYTAASVSSAEERYILVDTATVAVTVTLTTADCRIGKAMTIKDYAGNANTLNITIATEGTEKIDGANTQTINTNYGYLNVVSNGSNWFITGRA